MNVVSRGIRNAFRNVTRSVSIILILGLAIGLALVMLIARQAVSNKINSVDASVGNTVSISPAGYSGLSSVNNALTTNELAKVKVLAHVTNLTEALTDRLTTIGDTSSPFGNSAGGTNQTSLISPVKINFNRVPGGGGSGRGLFFSGGPDGFSLPSNFSPPVGIIGTTDPSSVNSNSITLVSGSLIGGYDNSNNAMVSTSMASKNNLKIGSTFTAYGTTLTITGIFDASTNGLDNDIVVSLPTEQRLSGQSGVVTSAIASIDSLANLNSATNEIKNTLGSSADVVSAIQQAQDATKPLNNIKTISVYSLIGSVVAGTVIIFLIMIMIVRERRREIGVLKAIGASNFKIVCQFMSEAITLTVVGAVIGIIIGIAAANPITHLLVTSQNSSPVSGLVKRGSGGFRGIANGNGNFTLRQASHGPFRGLRNDFSNIQTIVGWSVVLDGIGAAIIIAIIGSTASSFLIAKVRPAEVMRME